LVWYEAHESMNGAITREKQIKAGSRKKKLGLIEASNSEWKDLYESIIDHLTRHCEEPTGRANARPMTGSATKQSRLSLLWKSGLLRSQ
jgi:hypothetical protein